MDKEQGYIYSMLSTAYSANIIKTVSTPDDTTFEFYLECRARIEPLIDALKADMTSYYALIDLKQELVSYKSIHIILNKRFKRKNSENLQTNEQYALLRSLLPSDIVQLTTQAEIMWHHC